MAHRRSCPSTPEAAEPGHVLGQAGTACTRGRKHSWGLVACSFREGCPRGRLRGERERRPHGSGGPGEELRQSGAEDEPCPWRPSNPSLRCAPRATIIPRGSPRRGGKAAPVLWRPDTGFHGCSCSPARAEAADAARALPRGLCGPDGAHRGSMDAPTERHGSGGRPGAGTRRAVVLPPMSCGRRQGRGARDWKDWEEREAASPLNLYTQGLQVSAHD